MARIKDVLRSNFMRRPGCHVEALNASRFVCQKFGQHIPSNIIGKYIVEVLGVEKIRRRVGYNKKKYLCMKVFFCLGREREGQIRESIE